MQNKRLNHFKYNANYDHIMSIKNTDKYLEIVCSAGSKIVTYKVFGESEDNFMVVKKGER